MIVIDTKTKLDLSVVVGLGFFDAVHLGHKHLLGEVCKLAKELGAKSAAFTFSNNPLSFFGHSKEILTFSERCSCFESLGLDVVIAEPMTEELRKSEGEAFLDSICNAVNVCAFVVGADYTFGVNASSNVAFLCNYAQKHGISVNVVDFVESTENGITSKISSRNIRKLLEFGDVEGANALMSEPYFMTCTVEHCTGRGHKLGFPTANVVPSSQKILPYRGVYRTKTVIDGKAYKSMTSIGSRPTFENTEQTVETYVLDYSGDLYGKSIKTSYLEYMRPNMKFENTAQLEAVLRIDEENVRAKDD